jgi:type I restriction-modification system DNA methylase subunit
MNKTKNNKTEKLLKEIWKAFDLLRGPLQIFGAFKIIFVLLHYKRFEKGYETYAKATYSGKGVGIHNDERAVRLYEQIYETLRNISAEAFGLQFTEISPDNAIIPVLGDEQECMTKESINKANSRVITQNVFTRLMTKIPQATRSKVLEILNSNDFSFKDVSCEDFEIVLSTIENKCMEIEGKRGGNYYINTSLSKLMVKLLNPHSDLRLNFPFCGLGQMLIAAVDHICEVSKPGLDSAFTDKGGKHDFFIGLNSEIELHDNNIETLSLAKLRVLAKVYNSYETGADEDVGEFYVNDIDHNSKADVIFLNPPFALRHPEHLPSKVDIDGNSLEIPRNNGELFELLNHVQKLSENGRMGIVMPYGVLSRSGNVRDIKKFLIESDYLEAVIQLPQKIFSQTSVQTAILIINKNKPKARKHRTLFAKAESSIEGKTVFVSDDEINRIVNTYNKAKGDIDAIVTLEEIQQQDYDLSPDRYIGFFPRELETLLSNEEVVLLEKISTIIRGKTRKPEPDENNGLPFITTKDLAKDVIDTYLNYDKCFLGVPLSKDKVFDMKCILVSVVGNSLKPTIFDPKKAYKGEPDNNGIYHDTHQGVLLGPNIIAIIPNEQIVDIEYLYYQLYSPIVEKMIKIFLMGAGGIPRIALQHLVKLVIHVPVSIEEQRRSIRQEKQLLIERENAKLEAVKTKLGIYEKKQEAEYEIVRHLAHDIKPKINIVGAPLRTIIDFLNKEGLLDNEVSSRSDGTKKSARETLNIALEGLSQINNVLDSARDIVTREIKRNEFQKTSITDLFENNIIPSYENKPYKISIECKDKELEVLLHVKSFIEAINNIIRNAEMHAFSDDVHGQEIKFSIHEDINEEEVYIDYTNNGHPFPTNMNTAEFLSFGKKSNESNGEGLGGAWIGKVIEAHNGFFEIINDSSPIHFLITLPKGV